MQTEPYVVTSIAIPHVVVQLMLFDQFIHLPTLCLFKGKSSRGFTIVLIGNCAERSYRFVIQLMSQR